MKGAVRPSAIRLSRRQAMTGLADASTKGAKIGTALPDRSDMFPADTHSPSTEAPLLSIVLPFYKKLEDFSRVARLNHRYFAREGIEVVIALDENTEEPGLLALLGQYPDVQWKVLVNDQPHDWRPPCKAINVGLRHAAGRYVLVCSPESAFVGDVPVQMLRAVRKFPNGVAIGRVGFARFDEVSDDRTLAQVFAEKVPQELQVNTFYGSLCAPRQAFEAVRGYDEAFLKWGGDDDNLRVRMEMAGFKLIATAGARLLHLSLESRTGGEQFDFKSDLLKCSPDSAQANQGMEWGREFSRLARVNQPPAGRRTKLSEELAAGGDSAPAFPVPSRRRCRACGRLLHLEGPTPRCPVCQSFASGSSQAAAAGASRLSRPAIRPKIACVLQLRNESAYLEGCLAHLRDHVDGFVALDDGSTDATAAILRREPKLLDCIAKPPQANHVWNELENKRLLLQRAKALGVDWVLCCDADERFEIAFLKRLYQIAGRFPAGSAACFYVALRELWDTPMHYRIDGVWGEKARARFFSLPDSIEFGRNQELHGEWYPDYTRRHGRMLRIDHNLYHLKTIRREDRIKRRDFYKRLDPDNKFQAIGYDYLAEEGEGLTVEKIAPGREYDFSTLPGALKLLFSKSATIAPD